MILLAHALAEPLPLVDCGPEHLLTSMPMEGATGVGTDAVPALVFDGCTFLQGEAELWDGETSLGRRPLTVFGAGEAIVAEVRGLPLVPDTSHRITLETENGTVDLGFSTGSARTEPFPHGSPTLELVALDALNDTARAVVAVTSDSDRGGFHLISSGNRAIGVVPRTGPVSEAEIDWYPTENPICLTAAERDGLGVLHGPSEEVCEASACGCSATGGPMWPWALGGLLGLLGLRRRALPRG